jgi:hypothetical protein
VVQAVLVEKRSVREVARAHGVKRPGFAGGSVPTEGWADASTEEVSG